MAGASDVLFCVLQRFAERLGAMADLDLRLIQVAFGERPGLPCHPLPTRTLRYRPCSASYPARRRLSPGVTACLRCQFPSPAADRTNGFTPFVA